MFRLHRGGRDARPAAEGQIGRNLPRPQGHGNSRGQDAAWGSDADGSRDGRVLGQAGPLHDAIRLRVSVDRAAELLGNANHAVALTGAGVSAESGIPTFRGVGGLWTEYDPVKVASIDSFLANPNGYWEVARERGGIALAARPNPGHEALAALEAQGRLVAVITQ